MSQMKKIINIITRLKPFLSSIIFIGLLISSITVIVGLISNLINFGQKGLFQIIQNYYLEIWIISITIIVILLYIWINIINKRFVIGFSDKFDGDLKDKWDYVGDWSIPKKGELMITKTDPGGITKVGTHWENYKFEFKARILKKCIGVIVRAKDLNNYYMLQIHNDRIRPHRRAEVPEIVESKVKQDQKKENGVENTKEIKFVVGWEIDEHPTPITPPLDNWFDVIIKVKGTSILVTINGEVAYKNDTWLQIPSGKVGFRNSRSESAFVSNVKVTLLN